MKRLKSLDVDEISLVDIGANKKKFLVFKSKYGSEQMSKITERIIKSLRIKKEAPADEEKKEAAKKEAELKKAEGDMLPSKDSAVYKVSEGAQAALKAIARILTPFKEELKDEHIEQALKEAGIKKEAESESEVENKDELRKLFAIPEEVKEEHAVDALNKAKEAMDEHLEKLGYRKYGDEEVAMKECEMEDSVHKAKFDNIFKAHKELVQKNADLEAKIKKMQNNEIEKEIVQKSATFTHIGIKKEDLVEDLREAKKVSEERYQKVCKRYEALNEQIKKSNLFNELGSGLSNNGASDSEAKIDVAVKEIVKKSNKSYAESYSDFIATEEGKKLYAEMKQSRPNGI